MEDEIAIVGIGCRFPGADNVDEFWRVLENGENHVKDIPKERWNHEAFYDEDKNAPGKINVKKAGLLDNHDTWDNRLFRISGPEAERVDPQHAYLLECVHMAMEDGGITRTQLDGTKTGCYIGTMNSDYQGISVIDNKAITGYSSTGGNTSILSARVCYVYNLLGPCMSIDTACSSGLIAVHLASQAIKTGDCEQAICGGVNSLLTPDTFLPTGKAGMLSPTGQCQAFCDTADGYVRSEGCGIVILKSMKAALRDGNKIWATIKTGTNQDGRTAHPMTAPSTEQQKELLSQVYKNGTDATAVQYIEAHGTGTPIGDPTEVDAIGEFFSKHRISGAQNRLPVGEFFSKHRIICGHQSRLPIGSVKTNIGHTESAAGVAGLIKVLLMMKHGKLVPSLHVMKDKSNINKKLRLKEYGLDVCVETTEWKPNMENERIACVNSFGFGGSNCHAVVKQTMPKSDQQDAHLGEQEEFKIICISAVDKPSLKGNLEKFEDDLQSTDIALFKIAYTSCVHREHFAYRTMLVGKTKDDLLKECQTQINELESIRPARKKNIVFVYGGVGTSWTGMGRKMMMHSDVFRNTVGKIDKLLVLLTNWKIGERFLDENETYEDPFLQHIAIFATQVAHTEVWKSFGISPDRIVGQSVGEVAAAFGSGLLSLEDAVHVIYIRSKMLAKLEGGTMMVVKNLPVTTVEEVCKNNSGRVSVAVHSSPVACVLSGETNDINTIREEIEEVGKKENIQIFTKGLKVKRAYHSMHVEGCLEEMKLQIGKLVPNKNGKIPQISTVSADFASASDYLTGQYWADNTRKQVLFMEALQKSMDMDSQNIFVELGPRPVLRAHLPNILPEGVNGVSVASMSEKREMYTLLKAIAELYQFGLDINWNAHFKRVQESSHVPRYCFNRRTHLFVSEKALEHLSGLDSEANETHMFVKPRTKKQDNMEFKMLVDEKNTPFVFDHEFAGAYLMPGATYIETGFHIGQECLRIPIYKLMVTAEFTTPFTPNRGESDTIELKTKNVTPTTVEYTAVSNSQTMCSGKVTLRTIPDKQPVNIELLMSRCEQIKNKQESYDCLKKLGFQYGESLAFIQKSWCSEAECLTQLTMPDCVESDLLKTHFHPCIIDSMFQMVGVAYSILTGITFAVPQSVGAVVFNRSPQKNMFGYARRVSKSEGETLWNTMLLSPDGCVIAEVNSLCLRHRSSKNSLKYRLEWDPLQMQSKNLQHSADMHILYMSLENSKLQQLLCQIGHVECLNPAAEFKKDENWKPDIIVHHVPRKLTTGSETGSEVMEMAVNNLLELKGLFENLQRRYLSIPLFVVTECVQQVQGREEVKQNLHGSELWGMIRAARHEAIHTDIRLVDINPDNMDSELLARVLRNQWPHEYDICISGSQVYSARLKPVFKSGPYVTNDLVMDKTRHAVLSVKDPRSFQTPFFQPVARTATTSPRADKCVALRLKAFAKHNDLIFPTTEEDSENSVWHYDTSHQGLNIVVLEGTGARIDCPDEENDDVVFCSPVTAETTITVPEECIMPRKLLPSYVPGTLISACIIYHCMNEIPPESTVIVVHARDDNSALQSVCQNLLNQRKCNVQFKTDADLWPCVRTTVEKEPTIAMLLTSFDSTLVKYLTETTTSLQKIVSLKCLFPDKLLTWSRYKYPNMKIAAMATANIFSTESLKSSMPHVFDTLKEQQMEMLLVKSDATTSAVHISPLSTDAVLQYPMEEVDVEKALQNKTASFKADKMSLFCHNACYIIVAGLSGLGFEVLKVLAELGAGYIATFSRSPATESRQSEIESVMKEHNCKVICIQTDISDKQKLKQGMELLEQKIPNVPIKGVFHGASVLADSFLVEQTEEHVKIPLVPKVQGTWNLHILTRHLDLDFFVMHSSIASTIGNVGQTMYAAGNSFQDTMVDYRRALGLTAQAINWGALDLGMTLNNKKAKLQNEKYGINCLVIEQIREFFIEALLTAEPHVIYADIEWKTTMNNPSFSAEKAKFQMLVTSEFKSNSDMIQSERRKFDLKTLQGLSDQEKKRTITGVIISILCEIFLLDKERVNESATFVELGIDSMSVMGFVNTVRSDLKCNVPYQILLSDETTVSSFVDFLLKAIPVQ